MLQVKGRGPNPGWIGNISVWCYGGHMKVYGAIILADTHRYDVVRIICRISMGEYDLLPAPRRQGAPGYGDVTGGVVVNGVLKAVVADKGILLEGLSG
jgi:hypothetical protein